MRRLARRRDPPGAGSTGHQHAGRRLGGGLARRDSGGAGHRRRRPHRTLPLPRPIVAELAGAGARNHGQHRSGLSTDQQVLQPQLFGTRPLMWHLLRQIARNGIVTEPAPEPAPQPTPAVADADTAAVQRIHQDLLHILGQALSIRQVDAGSCNGCELEIHALNNPYYNLEGLGIRFVASPRHADLLLVTGPVSRHMAEALRRTYDATPEPKLVVAVGDCGCTGGIFGESYASCGRVANVSPVDVAVPGCPPTPVAIMQGILTAATSRS